MFLVAFFKKTPTPAEETINRSVDLAKGFVRIFDHFYTAKKASDKSLLGRTIRTKAETVDPNSEVGQIIADFIYMMRLVDSFSETTTPEGDTSNSVTSELFRHIETTKKHFAQLDSNYNQLREAALKLMIHPEAIVSAKNAFMVYIKREHLKYDHPALKDYLAAQVNLLESAPKLSRTILAYEDSNKEHLAQLAEIRSLIEKGESFIGLVTSYFTTRTRKNALIAYFKEYLNTDDFRRTTLFGLVLEKYSSAEFVTLAKHCDFPNGLADIIDVQHISTNGSIYDGNPHLLFTIAEKLNHQQLGTLLSEPTEQQAFLDKMKQLFDANLYNEYWFMLTVAPKLPAVLFNQLNTFYANRNIKTAPLCEFFVDLNDGAVYSIPQVMIAHASPETFSAWLDQLATAPDAFAPNANFATLYPQINERNISVLDKVKVSYQQFILDLLENRTPEEVTRFFSIFSADKNSVSEGLRAFWSIFDLKLYRDIESLAAENDIENFSASVGLAVLFNNLVDSINKKNPYREGLCLTKQKFSNFVGGDYNRDAQDDIASFFNLFMAIDVNIKKLNESLLQSIINEGASPEFEELVEEFMTMSGGDTERQIIKAASTSFSEEFLPTQLKLMQALSIRVWHRDYARFQVLNDLARIMKKQIVIAETTKTRFTSDITRVLFSQMKPTVAQFLNAHNTDNPWEALHLAINALSEHPKYAEFQACFSKILGEMMAHYYNEGNIASHFKVPKLSENSRSANAPYVDLVHACITRTPFDLFEAFCTKYQVANPYAQQQQQQQQDQDPKRQGPYASFSAA